MPCAYVILDIVRVLRTVYYTHLFFLIPLIMYAPIYRRVLG